jgi:Uma2 family endonuclease
MRGEPPTQTSFADRAGSVSFADFCAAIEPEQKADLIDGVVRLSPPETPRENALFGWLLTLIYAFTNRNNLGDVYASRVAFRIDDSNAIEPDIAFVLASRAHLAREDFIDGPPDLAVEVASPATATLDHVEKLEVYRKAGVAEYWIVDEASRRVILYRLAPDGSYCEIPPEDGQLASHVIDGFWLQPDWLQPDEQPGLLETLTTLLADQGPRP